MDGRLTTCQKKFFPHKKLYYRVGTFFTMSSRDRHQKIYAISPSLHQQGKYSGGTQEHFVAIFVCLVDIRLIIFH